MFSNYHLWIGTDDSAAFLKAGRNKISKYHIEKICRNIRETIQITQFLNLTFSPLSLFAISQEPQFNTKRVQIIWILLFKTQLKLNFSIFLHQGLRVKTEGPIQKWEKKSCLGLKNNSFFQQSDYSKGKWGIVNSTQGRTNFWNQQNLSNRIYYEKRMLCSNTD